MKKTNRILILFSAFVVTLSCGKKGRDTGPASVEWQNVIGGPLGEKAYATVRASDGGYIIVGSSISKSGDVQGSHGGTDAVVVKVDANGNRQWVKLYGGSNKDELHAIAAVPDGGYILAGYTLSSDGDVPDKNYNGDFWVMKIDAKGAIQWSRTYGGWLEDDATSVAIAKDGGYVVTGCARGNGGDISDNHGAMDIWVLKLDADGDKQWTKSYGGSDIEEAHSITACPDGGFAIAGYTASTDGDAIGKAGSRDAWVFKIDANGTILWNKRFGGSQQDEAYSIQNTPDNGFIVAGNASSSDGDITAKRGGNGNYNPDALIIKLDANGNKQWVKVFGGSLNDEAYSAMPASDGGYVFEGYTASKDEDINKPAEFGLDFWLAKLNANGELELSKCYNRSIYDWGLSAVSTGDGGYLLSGFSEDESVNNNGDGSHDMWILKVKPF